MIGLDDAAGARRGWRAKPGDATIDSIRDDTGQLAVEPEYLRALEAENDRLRREVARNRAALQQAERQFVRATSELASVYASRSWRVASGLRALYRRRGGGATGPAPAPAAPSVAPGGLCRSVSLIVLAPQSNIDPHAADPMVEIVPVPADDSGIVARCNAAAAAATGERIAIWDGVSRPQPGWLHALDESFERFERAGIAGALRLDSAGRIESAGWAVGADGQLAPLGQGERPDHPEFAVVAQVEAVVPGCVMVPAEVWRRMGGLDPQIASAQHAFADLSLRLRAAGLRVLCQPFARLHSAPAPRVDAWAAAYGRWRVRRRRAARGNGLAIVGLAPPPAPRALFVDSHVPTPDRDSGSVDSHWVLRVFVALGYQTTLLPVADLGRDDRYVEDLRRCGVRVVANGRVATAAAYLAQDPTPFDLVMLHRGSVATGAMCDLLRAHSPQAKLVFNTVDLHFLRLEREALLTRAPTKLDEAFRVQQTELAAITRADCTVLLSPAEQRIVAELLPRARTCVIPMARDIGGRRAPFAPRQGVLFVGGFRHAPNVDAIASFVRETWPLVRGRLRTSLSIVGAEAPPEVLALASEADGIAVLGHVPDLDAVLAGCRLTVAPLRFGAGVKGKILSSLAAGVPCVASGVAVEGMGLTDGREVRVADTPQAFAEAIVELHEHPVMWRGLSDAGLDFATRTFSVVAARRHLCAMLDDLGLPAGDPDRPGPI